MIQGKWFAPGETPDAALAVRQSVFGQGADDLDPLSWNVLVLQDDLPAAAGRIWWQDGAFRLGSIGVLPGLRGKRLGDLVLRLLLYKAQGHFAREVRLSSPPETAGFFARLGFRPDPAVPAGESSPLEMFLPGDQIDLDTCKNCPRTDCANRSSGCH